MLPWINILKEYQDRQESIALVTVTKCLGSTPCEVGSRMIVTEKKNIHGTIGGGKLEFLAIDEAIKAIQENRIIEETYTLGPEFEQCCGGKVEFIIEPMNQSPELFLFGAGHIGIELCTILKDTPFKVNLIDSRKDRLGELKLGTHVHNHPVELNDFKTIKDAVRWGTNCYMVVMTHDHTLDFDLIAMAIQNEAKFIGLIGSKTKRVRFHNMLVNELGIEEGMTNVVCPIGVKLKGNSPKEIAICIAAQLLEVHRGRS